MVHGEHALTNKMDKNLIIGIGEQAHENLSTTKDDLDSGYKQMAADERREAEAQEWAEATIEDVNT